MAASNQISEFIFAQKPDLKCLCKGKCLCSSTISIFITGCHPTERSMDWKLSIMRMPFIQPKTLKQFRCSSSSSLDWTIFNVYAPNPLVTFVSKRDTTHDLVASCLNYTKFSTKFAPIESRDWIKNLFFKGSIAFQGPIGIGKSEFISRMFDGVSRVYSEDLTIFSTPSLDFVIIPDFSWYISRFLSPECDPVNFPFHVFIFYRDFVLDRLYRVFRSHKSDFMLIFDRYFLDHLIFYCLSLFNKKAPLEPRAYASLMNSFFPSAVFRDIILKDLWPSWHFLFFADSQSREENAVVNLERVRQRGRVFEQNMTPKSVYSFYATQSYVYSSPLLPKTNFIIIATDAVNPKAMLRVLPMLNDLEIIEPLHCTFQTLVEWILVNHNCPTSEMIHIINTLDVDD